MRRRRPATRAGRSHDRLHLLEADDFVSKTNEDFANFLAGKSKPLGAILNDCICRRLCNPSSLARLRTFADIRRLFRLSAIADELERIDRAS